MHMRAHTYETPQPLGMNKNEAGFVGNIIY